MTAIAPLHDLDLHYEERGTGDPVLLIGGLGQTKEAWAPMAEALAEQYRVITFDNRGVGETGAPDLPYTVSGMAEDTAGLLRHLEIEKAHVVGASLGGIIAQHLAADHPKLVNRLVLAVTASRLDGYTRRLITSLLDIRRSSVSDRQFFEHLAMFMFSRPFFEDPRRLEGVLQSWASQPYANLDHGFVRQAEAVLEWGSVDPAEPPKQETLVLCAEHDLIFGCELGRELSERLPNGTCRELPGGHAGMGEYPRQWQEAIRDFLAA